MIIEVHAIGPLLRRAIAAIERETAEKLGL